MLDLPDEVVMQLLQELVCFGCGMLSHRQMSQRVLGR